MTTTFTNSTFSSRYKDDWTESDGYHRVLFNSGRAVQARELTQLQTIIQAEVGRFGRNIFKEGAAVNPGGMTVNNSFEFIKLFSEVGLPLDLTLLIGSTFTGQTSGVKAKVIEVIAAEGADPATLYVQYTDTTAVTAGPSGIRMAAGEVIDNGTYSLTVQTTNTVLNPAVGAGTRVSIAAGDFFTQGHFVFAVAQNIIVSKYTKTPTVEVGFIVTQDIVTASDTTALYDNQGANPNLSAAGADRYRIRLIGTTRDQVATDETFVYVAKIQDGVLVDAVTGNSDYNRINDLMALRTKEESGNYNVKPFRIQFELNDSDNTKLDMNISDGISYVNGYRAAKNYPSTIIVPKAQDTVAINNEVVASNYGNYVIGTGGFGARDINILELVNLRTAATYGGTTIGTARVRAVEEDGVNFRYSLFDINMNAGTSFRNVQSFGTSATDYVNLILENGKAVLKETGNNTLLFPLPNSRPSNISDISLTVQRRFSTTTDGSGLASLTLTNTGETFANTNQWFFSNADSAYTVTPSVSGAGTQSASISSAPISSTNFEILAYVNKAAGVSRTKTLLNTTVTGVIESDGGGIQFINLGRADIYDVSRMRTIDSDGTDLTNRFTVDNGQRDNSYDLGRLVLRGGQTAPAGNVFARFDYFSHGTSGDFFSVNSYAAQVNYEDIPSHTRNDGTIVQLRDVLDFRPVKNASGTFSTGNARVNELPQNTDLITTDVVYYQPRYSKLIIDTSGVLQVISGPSSLTPILPPTPANALTLYNIKLNAFTLNDSDMFVEAVETRRYTMADIGRLETRLSNLEEITALSLLELDTANFDVLDSAGVNRTKSGFLVDNFTNHFFTDTTNTEHRASIDPTAKIMRPAFSVNNTRLIYDSDLSTNTVRKGDNVYLNHTHVPQIAQVLATETENVNPFAVITHRGALTMSPSSDNWSEQRRIAARAVDGNSTLSTTLGFNWNNWQWNWGGVRTIGNFSESAIGSGTRSISSSGLTTVQTIRQIVGDRIVDVALIPFMRSIKVFFKGEGMRPNCRVFAYFDGRSVADWVRTESFSRFSINPIEYGNTQNTATQHPDTASILTTDDEGYVEGSFFIPNTNNIRFRTGTREFKLLDVTTSSEANALSIASTLFTSAGVIETHQADVVTTRVVTVAQPQEQRSGDASQDPLAQSFFVETLEGIFATKVDIYFATKDSTIPVQVQLRQMINGSPSSESIPGSVKFLAPASVTTSTDATVATTFEFDEPVYLAPRTEYAIVVLAESIEYTIYVAAIEKFLIGSTEKRVTAQPTMGSLFKSQNGSTWEPDQTRDMTFQLWRADFTSMTGSIVLENTDLPLNLLGADPITATSASSTVNIFHPNHGFTVGGSVVISGIDSAEDIGGISGASVLGTRTITAVDYTGYSFAADSAATSSAIGGGSNVFTTQNVMYDVFVPNIETLIPNDTSASYQAKLTTGVSFAGLETAYQKDATYIDIALGDNNVMEVPHLIANSVNEAAELGAGVKSVTIKIDLSSASTRVSPVIDLQRASMFLINNQVDKQAASPASGYNVPLNFIDETDPSEGSSASKHIIKPVTLEEDAVGIKLLIAANRPSASDFVVYYRTGTDQTVITDVAWTAASLDAPVPSDENPKIFREYEYLIGGQGGNLVPFTQFQIKIVMRSTNSAKVSVIRDLRAIAMGV